MIRFYFHPTPNPAKVALLLEELGQPYEVIPVDTAKGEQHTPAFRAINPNGKLPAIADTDGPGGREARVFNSSAILLYLGEKAGRFIGTPAAGPSFCRGSSSSGRGLGPFSGQAVHFQHAAPEKIPYAVNRYRREIERHYRVLDRHLEGPGLYPRQGLFDRRHVSLGLAWAGLARAARLGRSARRLPESSSACSRRWRRARRRRERRRSAKIFPFKKEVDEANETRDVPVELS